MAVPYYYDFRQGRPLRLQDSKEEVQRLREVHELLEWEMGDDGPVHRPSKPNFAAEIKHNADAPLNTMPNELILIMGKDLSEPERRSFYLASNYIGHKITILRKNNAPMSSSDMMMYTKYRLRDAYNLACQLEMWGMFFDDARACSGCQETHPRADFAEHELDNPPTERRCLGLVGSLYICEHVQLKWDDLSDRFGRDVRYIECQHKDHMWQGGSAGLLTHLLGGPPSSQPDIGRSFSWRYSVILTNDGKEARTLEEWRQLILEKNHPLCPHSGLIWLVGKVGDFWRRTCQTTNNWPHGYSGYGVPPDEKIGLGRFKVHLRCPDVHCEMQATLMQPGPTQTRNYPGPFVMVSKSITVPKFCNSVAWRNNLVFKREDFPERFQVD